MSSYSIFLCSTFRDLRKERKSALSVLQRLKFTCNAMEYFGARPHKSIDACLQEVAKSDLLVVIVGFLYGDIVPKSGISFSEAEYKEGIRLGKPCLVYFQKENIANGLVCYEKDKKKKKALLRWKTKLKEDHTIATFKNPQELSIMLAIDLSRALLESALLREKRQSLTFLSGLLPLISREVNAHVSVINRSAQAMNSKNKDKRCFEANTIQKCCSHIRRIFDQFNTLAQEVLGENKNFMNMNSVLEEIIHLIQRFRKNITFRHFFNKTPVMVESYSSLMSEVFLNIIVNAVQSIGKAKGMITITTKIKQNDAIITIADTGCGIIKPYLKSIFNPFFTTEKDQGGIGLGLTVVKAIIEKNNGEIFVKSKVKKGTTVTVCLPLAN